MQHCWLTTPNIVGCYMLRPHAHPVAYGWKLLHKLETGQTFEPTIPNISCVPWSPSIAQQCWIDLYSSSNIVGPTHVHYIWFTTSHWLHPSHFALEVPTLLGVVASNCTPLQTQKQQIPTLWADNVCLQQGHWLSNACLQCVPGSVCQ